MDNKTGENLYLGIIGDCKEVVSRLRSKVSIITTIETIEERLQGLDTPCRTDLERELKVLLQQLKDLEGDVVIK